jgi:cytochrome c oxidase subunit 4
MADTHATDAAHAAHDAHDHPSERTYMMVFAFLCVFTAVSFLTVSTYWPLSPDAGHTVVMIVAVVKALLVAMFFMHLKYDWFRVYVMVVPALILGTGLILALMPDITFSKTRVMGDNPPPAATMLP